MIIEPFERFQRKDKSTRDFFQTYFSCHLLGLELTGSETVVMRGEDNIEISLPSNCTYVVGKKYCKYRGSNIKSKSANESSEFFIVKYLL